MEQELVKQVVRVGNSAGVILPREWLNAKAKVKLVGEPLNIKKNVLEILAPYLGDVIGIYIVGSYAREEETERSDVDVLVGIRDRSSSLVPLFIFLSCLFGSELKASD